MIDDQLRRMKEALATPLARAANRILSPLAMTLLAFVVALAASYLLWQRFYIWALFLWVFSRLCDGLDGSMARLSGRQSEVGGYLDLVCDVVVYALFPLAAAAANGTPMVWRGVGFLLAAYYINLTCWSVLAAILEKRAATLEKHKRQGNAPQRTTTVIMPRGIIEGFETVLIYTAFCIFPQIIWHLFVITAILTMLSALIRVVWVVRNRSILEGGGDGRQ